MPSRTIKTVTARLEEDIVAKANVVASLRKIASPDYLSGIIRPIVERDYAEEIRKAAKEMEEGGGSGGAGRRGRGQAGQVRGRQAGQSIGTKKRRPPMRMVLGGRRWLAGQWAGGPWITP